MVFLRSCCITALICAQVFSATVDVSIKGKVTDGSAGIQGATVSLKKFPAIKNTTAADGAFELSGQIDPTAVAPFNIAIEPAPQFGIKGSAVHFTIDSPAKSGSIVFFAGNGRQSASVPLGNLEAGSHRAAMPRLAIGFYIMQVTIDGFTTICKLVTTGSGMQLSGEEMNPAADNTVRLAKELSASVDEVVAAKTGFTTKSAAIDSYTKTGMEIVLTSTTPKDCPAFTVPAFSALKNITELPDPFMFYNGTRMTKKSEWPCRRAEIVALAEAFIYGPKPPKPEKVEATYSGGTLKITCTEGGKSVNFSVSISGNTGTGLMPACIGIDGGTGLGLPSGVAKISYSVNNVAKGGMSGRGTPSGIFYTLYPNSKATGALMAWGWGCSRIVDALELTQDQTKIDPTKLAVVGCSYGGKAAFVCGAFDDRIALVLPMESGSGGCSTWRLSELTNHKGSSAGGCQYAEEIYGEAPWMGADFGQFGKAVDKLPVDQHAVLAICAPRGLWINEGSANAWNCPTSNWHSGNGCHMVYEALGVPDNMGITMSDHAHCASPNGLNEKTIWNNFFKKFLFGDATANTSPSYVIKNDKNFTIDKKWIPWTVPTLQ